MKKRVACLLIFILIFCAERPVYAMLGQLNGFVASVTRLELSDGIIYGHGADYAMQIPPLWQGYLICERENTSSAKPLDKLFFYYVPTDKKTKPMLALTMSVFDKYDAAPPEGFRLICESKRYSFFVEIAKDNKLTDMTDNAIFNVITVNASDDRFLSGLIVLSQNDTRIYRDRIFTDGKQLNTQVYKNGNSVYLPLRDVCLALGFRINWLADKRAISVAKGEQYVLLFTDKQRLNGGIEVVMHEGKAYVPALFFVSKLKQDAEIDEYGNVFIYSGGN